MSIAIKISTLVIRTLAKPISATLKEQAKSHATFRKACVGIAQTVHRFDINLRMNLLGEKGEQEDEGSLYLTTIMVLMIFRPQTRPATQRVESNRFGC